VQFAPHGAVARAMALRVTWSRLHRRRDVPDMGPTTSGAVWCRERQGESRRLTLALPRGRATAACVLEGVRVTDGATRQSPTPAQHSRPTWARPRWQRRNHRPDIVGAMRRPMVACVGQELGVQCHCSRANTITS